MIARAFLFFVVLFKKFLAGGVCVGDMLGDIVKTAVKYFTELVKGVGVPGSLIR